MRPVGSKLEKINSRWEHGIFVGVRRRSNELWIATKDKLLSVRSVRRIPVEHRWGSDSLSWVQSAPWIRYKDAQDADGDLPEGVPVVDPIPGNSAASSSLEGPRIVIRTKDVAPRDFQITMKDIETLATGYWQSTSTTFVKDIILGLRHTQAQTDRKSVV